MWSSGNTAVATVGSGSGIVIGVSAGSVLITYTIPTGCYMTKLITVNPLPSAITGITEICAGLSGTLSDATTGGTWSSGNTTVVLIGVSSGIYAGIAAGTADITYTASTGGRKEQGFAEENTTSIDRCP